MGPKFQKTSYVFVDVREGADAEDCLEDVLRNGGADIEVDAASRVEQVDSITVHVLIG